MKKNIEITGILRVVEKETWNVVDLFSNDVKLGEFVFNPKHKSINVELSKSIGKILGINVTEYLDYMKLIADLGLEIPQIYKRHCTPKLKESTLGYFIDSKGQVGANSFSNSTFDNELVANFNIFPNKELAEKAVNLSKLGRLILLWQYTNNCIFTPDWDNFDQPKHSIIYDELYKDLRVDMSYVVKGDKVYFETEEQAQAFIDMYSEEIKKIMGVI